MKLPFKLIILTVILLVFSSNQAYSQCTFGGTDSGVVVNPILTPQNTTNIQAGRYFLMNVISGGSYTVTTCGLTSWDTQLTVYSSTGTYIGYNDDVGGSCGRRSTVSFTASFTGQVRVILHRYNCSSSSDVTQVQYSGTPVVQTVSVNDVTVVENVGNATFTVTLSGGNVPGGFTVDYATSNNTAISGSDYTATSGTLSFAGTNNETKTITVPIIDDAAIEVDEDFLINLSNISNPSVIVSGGTGTITDDDLIINPPVVLVEEFDGYYDYASTGGTLRTNSNSTDACSITTSSSGTLTTSLSPGATVEKAYLYWAHSGATPDTQVIFEGNTVSADVTYGSFITSRTFYGSVSDVTSIINGIADPSTETYNFSGLTIDNSSTYCSSATVLGAWSLIIFYSSNFAI